MRTLPRARVVTVLVALIALLGVSGIPAMADEPAVRSLDPATYTPPFDLSSPVDGVGRFSDSFGVIRDGGDRLHHGIDIGAPLGTPVLAAAAGVVTRIDSGPTAGLYVEVTHSEGWVTRYLHLNDVAPPPDQQAEEPAPDAGEAVPTTAAPGDAAPSADEAVAAGEPAAEGGFDAATTDTAAVVDETPEPPEEPPIADEGWGIPDGIAVGGAVETGAVIGYVGYSGNASPAAPHLHFELRMPDRTPVNPYPFLSGDLGERTLLVVPDLTDEPLTWQVGIVGHIDPGTGFSGVVRAHDGVAYVGSYGDERACLAPEVRRYDVSDPTVPVELAPLVLDHPGTWVSALWIGDVTTAAFSGTLAIVAHTACEPATMGEGGLTLFDATDPLDPTVLGFYPSGPGTRGVSDLDVWHEDGTIRVIAAVPNSRMDHDEQAADVRIVDVSDPVWPIDVADWDVRRDTPLSMRQALAEANDLEELRAVGVAFDPSGDRAFVAHWDAGLVVLDLSELAAPVLAGRDASLGYSEGNARSVAFDAATGIVVVGHEDFDPLDDEIFGASWGADVILDTGAGGDPVLLSSYTPAAAAPDEDGRVPLDGFYTPRDMVIADGYLYGAWASGGVRIVGISEPSEPVEVGWFLPPTKVDPQRVLASPNGNIGMSLAWSVDVADGLIYVSDLNTGLWILRRDEPPLGGR
jgi:hypothetical protein